MQDNVLINGREAQYQSVLTQNVFFACVFSITILCPRMGGELVFLATTSIFPNKSEEMRQFFKITQEMLKMEP